MAQISEAVEKAHTKPTPQQVIQGEVKRYRPVIAKLLADTGQSVDQFEAMIVQAVRATPDLLKCDPATVIGAALKCAQNNLIPNTHANLAWILPYGQVAQFQLGYGGVMELARRAVPGLRFDGRPVYPNDDFDVDYGKVEPLTHRPAVTKGMSRGGSAYAWYVRATFPDGSTQLHVLDAESVEYHRAFSKQPNGQMWTKSYDAAALKSVVVDMRRWLPASPQLASAVAADEQVLDVRNIDQTTDEIVIPADESSEA